MPASHGLPLWAICMSLTMTGAARAQGPITNEPPAIRALQEAKFPQPVRVGDLQTWPVIASGGQYKHLGEVFGVFQPKAGAAQLVFRNGDFWGLGGRLVATPIDEVALVGPMVKVDMDQGDIDQLPTFKAQGGAFLHADDRVRIGVDKKY